MIFPKIGYICDIGNIRKENQDRILVLQKDEAVFCGIADGMGGMFNGSAASEYTISSLKKWCENTSFYELSVDNIMDLIYDKIIEINEHLVNYCNNNNVRTGTTLTFMYSKENRCGVFYSGDTRLYHIRNGIVNQLTEDETLYNYYKNYDDAAENSEKNKSILMSYIGKNYNVAITMKQKEIQSGDTILICSDGAYNYIDMYSKENIDKINRFDTQELIDILADDIKKQRASDNFSIIAIKYK